MKPSQEDWQKLVFKRKKLFCSREIEFFIIIKQNEKSTCMYQRGVWSGKYISFATVGKFGKEKWPTMGTIEDLL